MTNLKCNTNPLYITRFVAAYSVLMFHFLPPQYYSDQSLIGRLGEAVNYFFFISGFVMIVANRRYLIGQRPVSTFSKKEFWAKRFARIYPMYILALLLCVLFHYCVAKYDPSIPYRFPAEALGVQRWIYAGSINFPGWSVSCEFLFYFLFPFVLPFLVSGKNRKVAFLIIGFLLFSMAITYVWGTWIIDTEKRRTLLGLLNSSFYNHPIFKFSVFLFGTLCGVVFLRYNAVIARYARYAMPAALISASLIFLVLWRMPKSSPLIEGGLLTPFYFVFTIAICSLPDKWSGMLSNKLFIFLGEISYGIYILQAPALLFFEYYLNDGAHIATITQFVSYTAFLVAACGILFYLYEKPAKSMLLALFDRKAVRADLLTRSN